MVSLFALFSWYFCIIVGCIKSMHSYNDRLNPDSIFGVLLVVWFVCLPFSFGTLYFCRLYEINAFLHDRQNPGSIFVVL